jgi:hypothetical protein
MFSDTQLRNFEHYLKVTPKSRLGIDPGPTLGAYDAVGGRSAHGFGLARGHGFGHRRGIDMKHFRRGGAFDASGENGENGENADLPKSGQVWKKLEAMLQPLMGDQEFQDCSKLIEDLVFHCKAEAKNEAEADDDGELDAETMDRRRTARDDPSFPGATKTGADPRFNSLVRNNKGGAMDSRRPVSRGAVDSFNELFGNPAPMRRV